MRDCHVLRTRNDKKKGPLNRRQKHIEDREKNKTEVSFKPFQKYAKKITFQV